MSFKDKVKELQPSAEIVYFEREDRFIIYINGQWFISSDSAVGAWWAALQKLQNL